MNIENIMVLAYKQASSTGLEYQKAKAELRTAIQTAIVEARAEERERCVKIACSISNSSGGDKYDMFGNDLAKQCVAAIRNIK